MDNTQEIKKSYIHESSYIDAGCQIGPETKIWHFCHLMKNCIVGENCNIGQNVFIAEGVIIGNGVKIQNNVSLYSGIVCEDDVFLGPSCVFTNVMNPRSHVNRKDEYKKTTIRKGATIGANATIVCGNEIGKYAFVGAGSVVTKNIPEYGLCYGTPAELVGWVCECGERLELTESFATCWSCKQKYRLSEGKLEKFE